MKAHLDLKVEAEKLAEKANSKAHLDTKFGLEYLIPMVTEDMLFELGYEYSGESQYFVCPTYQKENIFALFNQGILHIGEIITKIDDDPTDVPEEEDNNEEK